MTKPSTITQWLMQPEKFSDKDRKEAAALIKTYPYFVPTRYVEAAEHHKKQPFAPPLLNMMHLYMGNWLLFYEYLQTATGKQSYTTSVIDGEDDDDNDTQLDELQDNQDYTEEDFIDDLDFGSYEEQNIEETIGTTDGSKDKIIVVETPEEEPFAFIEQTENSIEPENNAGKHKAETVKEKKVLEDKEVTLSGKAAEDISKPGKSDITESIKAEAPQEAVKIQEEHVVSTKPEEKQQNKKKEHPEKRKDEIPLFFQNRKNDSLIQPIYTEDYFLHQGLHVSDELPNDARKKQEDKSLMVVMSFSEWLLHFKTKGEREKEEQEDQKALKTMWQKEKLAAALEEENEEIPETVFEMAVNSITKEEDLASEPLAEIMVKQGKYDKAIDMYRKLSLRNPQKKAYFARKIDELQKEKDS